MGGERETEIEKTETKKGTPKGKTDIGAYRLHQKDAEIHVHDDTNKLKVSVPVVAWWKMWDKLRNEPGTWIWLDPAHKTKLTMQTVLDANGADVTINVAPVTFGDTWEKVNTFTKKK